MSTIHDRLAAQRASLMPPPADPEALRVVNVISAEAYRQLEKELPVIIVNDSTTDLQAGVMLGVQLVMNKLRQGWVSQ